MQRLMSPTITSKPTHKDQKYLPTESPAELSSFSKSQVAAQIFQGFHRLPQKRAIGYSFTTTTCIGSCQSSCKQGCLIPTNSIPVASTSCGSCCKPNCNVQCAQRECPNKSQPTNPVVEASPYRNAESNSVQPIVPSSGEPRHEQTEASSLVTRPCSLSCTPRCGCIQKQMTSQNPTQRPFTTAAATIHRSATSSELTTTTETASTTHQNQELPQADDALPSCIINCQEVCVQQCIRQELLLAQCSPSCISSCAENCAHMQTPSQRTTLPTPTAVRRTSLCLSSSPDESTCLCPEGFIICITPAGTGQCCQKG